MLAMYVFIISFLNINVLEKLGVGYDCCNDIDPLCTLYYYMLKTWYVRINNWLGGYENIN